MAAALYVLVDVVAPFEHHDLICHLKTPAHCTACASSPVSTSPRTMSGPGAISLADAGSAIAPLPGMKTALLAVRSTGRSPPAAL